MFFFSLRDKDLVDCLIDMIFVICWLLGFCGLFDC